MISGAASKRSISNECLHYAQLGRDDRVQIYTNTLKLLSSHMLRDNVSNIRRVFCGGFCLKSRRHLQRVRVSAFIKFSLRESKP